MYFFKRYFGGVMHIVNGVLVHWMTWLQKSYLICENEGESFVYDLSNTQSCVFYILFN